jgi:hypothetical protein
VPRIILHLLTMAGIADSLHSRFALELTVRHPPLTVDSLYMPSSENSPNGAAEKPDQRSNPPYREDESQEDHGRRPEFT